jgi:glycine dehydrogenase subunit 1
MRLLSKIDGVRAPVFESSHFKEFTVNFDETGLSAADVHKKLLQKKIHGGKDLSKEFPELGETALYCVTEIHSKDEIERLAEALEETLARR